MQQPEKCCGPSCTKTAAEVGLQKCGHCRAVAYSRKECQRELGATHLQVVEALQLQGFVPLPACACDVIEGYLEENEPVALPGFTSHWSPALSTPEGLLASLGAETPVPVVQRQGTEAYGGGSVSLQPLGVFLSGGKDYLKDFHLPPALASASYCIPPALCDDALNPWMDNSEGGQSFRFLYAGFAGTRTPLHHDILLSHSWSCNTAGEKLWLLVSPGASEALLYPRGRFQALAVESLLPAPVQRVLEDCGLLPPSPSSSAAAPHLPPALQERLLSRHPGCLRFHLQKAGEAIFVPSGWHHEVFNLGREGLTISINHNWISVCSGPCLQGAYRFLAAELAEVRERLQDCKGDPEFDFLCERALKTDAGLGLTELAQMLVKKVRDLRALLDRGEEGGAWGSAARLAWVAPGVEHAAPASSRERIAAGLENCASVLRLLEVEGSAVAASGASCDGRPAKQNAVRKN